MGKFKDSQEESYATVKSGQPGVEFTFTDELQFDELDLGVPPLTELETITHHHDLCMAQIRDLETSVFNLIDRNKYYGDSVTRSDLEDIHRRLKQILGDFI